MRTTRLAEARKRELETEPKANTGRIVIIAHAMEELRNGSDAIRENDAGSWLAKADSAEKTKEGDQRC